MKLSNEAANAAADAVAVLLNSGKLRFYTGSAPATADAAASGTLLAELTYAVDAFGNPSAGVSTAAAITSDSSADATGTAGYARSYKSDGTSPILQHTVGTSGADINLVTTSIVSGQPVEITSMTLTCEKG